MNTTRTRPAWGLMVYFALALTAGTYFTFAAVQGDFGLFRRVEVEADRDRLAESLEALRAEVAIMENRTLRLSDEYLDLDLLDERARQVLGLIRADEIVIR